MICTVRGHAEATYKHSIPPVFGPLVSRRQAQIGSISNKTMIPIHGFIANWLLNIFLPYIYSLNTRLHHRYITESSRKSTLQYVAAILCPELKSPSYFFNKIKKTIGNYLKIKFLSLTLRGCNYFFHTNFLPTSCIIIKLCNLVYGQIMTACNIQDQTLTLINSVQIPTVFQIKYVKML